MNLKMILKDFKKNKVITITLVLFLIFSSALLSVGAFTILHLRGTMNELFEIAKPPHFLQMHTGEIDKEKVLKFGEKYPYVQAQEIVEMLNIQADSIAYVKQNGDYVSMSGNSMDNGFVVQNKHLDYLVDLSNKIINVNEGEIGVPISYMKSYGLEVGDTLVIQRKAFKKEFKISCFVRDAQMGASMASSTRFLVSEKDMEILESNIGDMEYIMEYRFESRSDISKFQSAYTDKKAGMPVNGQAITYSLILLINGLSGGLLAGTMILVSLLLIVVAIMNLRSIILSSLEEDRSEIGVMKAIGYSKKDVKNHYLVKYKTLTIFGCVMGAICSVFFRDFLVKDITFMFGPAKIGIIQTILPCLSVLFVYLFIVFSCKKILKRIDKMTVVETLIYDGDSSKKKKLLKIKNTKFKNINCYIGLKKVLLQMKSLKTIILVFMIATAIVIIPVNILNTFESPDFISYMGRANCDIGIDFNEKRTTKDNVDRFLQELADDKSIKEFSVYETYEYEVNTEDGIKPFKVDCGDFSKFKINCTEGHIPDNQDEIALSSLNAKELEVKVNDKFILNVNGKENQFIVSGIYQDITSGGYTAKGVFKNKECSTGNYSICVNLKDKNNMNSFVEKYEKEYSFAKVIVMETTVQQSFGTMISSLKGGTVISVIIAVLIVVLVILLFLKLQTTRDMPQNAIYQAIGFTGKEIKIQYLLQMLVTSVIGILLGIVLTATVGEKIVEIILSVLGLKIDKFHFIWNYIVTFSVCPIGLLLLSAGATWLSQKSSKSFMLARFIKE